MSKKKQDIVCRIVPPDLRSADSAAYLCVLYEPLIGVRARTLYDMLGAFCLRARQCWSLDELLAMMDLKKNRFEAERRHLEDYGLLQTFADETREYLEFHLEAPLCPEQFFADEIFSRLYLKTVGKTRFEQAKALFDVCEKKDNLKNISSTLAESGLLEDWDDAKELDYLQNNGSIQNLQRYPFDWNIFFQGMNVQIPNNLRTLYNRMRIARLANFYGIAEEDMQKHVVRCIRQNRTLIDFDVLEELLQKSTKRNGAEARQAEPTLDMSPVVYLMKKTGKNVRLIQKEQSVLTRLSDDYEFPNEVINTLVDYALKECRNQFNSKYIYTVANTWAREKIETAKQARAYIEQEKKIRESGFAQPAPAQEVPDWYEDTGQNDEADPDLIAQALAIQAQLRNNDQHN